MSDDIGTHGSDDESTGETDLTCTQFHRRNFLKATAAAGAATMGLGGAGSVTAATDSGAGVEPAHDPSKMSTTQVDVEDGDEVSGIIRDVDDGELLEFPEGEFWWTESVLVVADNWGIKGQPDDGTVFKVPEGRTADKGFPKRYTFRTGEGSSITGDASDNVLLKDLTFDSPGRANPSLRLGVRTRGHVQNLHYRCNGTIGVDGGMTNGVSAYVQSEDGHLTINNYLQHNNGRLSDYDGGNGRVALWTGGGHNGTATVINPVLTGFPNNACYVGRTAGTVDIIGGYLANNNVSDVRLSDGITVRGTTMELDTEAYAEGPGETTGGSAYNTRMVWGDRRGSGEPGGLVKNCSFILQSYDESQGLVDILDNPHITVENCQFLLNDEIGAVNAAASDEEIRLSNCGFTGSAAATAGVTSNGGTITGQNNCVAGEVEPGAVPVNSNRDDCGNFNWGRVHPLGRPEDDSSD